MKIRTGFVSNSSSSSFVCWGVFSDDIKFSEEKLLEEFACQMNNNKNIVDNQESTDWERDDASEVLREMSELDSDEEKTRYIKDIIEYDMQEFLENKGISFGGQKYGQYAGLTPCDIIVRYPEVTFGKVREFVAEKLTEVFGTEYTKDNIQYTQQGWYDG
jgi:hypothetical protein